MSEFVAGFAARHEVAAGLLRAAFAPAPTGFAAVDPRARVAPMAAGAAGMGGEAGPKHFSPANRAENPTAGWNPLDATAEPTPFVDPVEAAHAAGYAEGVAAAAAAANAAQSRDADLLTGIAGSLGADRLDREAMAARLRQTVLMLVTRVVGDVGVAADRLAARIDAAAGMLADAAESAMLRVHPDDVALLDGRLPATIFAVGDASVDRGSFVLESASTVVEDGPAMWLEQLAAAIDRVPLPTALAA
ncbi:FliH/SctL family protein [Sphingomonas sp. KR1UV-12]|uniref:FliH/SctL family protein n=1 Tax=Sphingomonas aurea TaxID=3063994 RepID=A0ABT9ENH2_9SPHN|nr:FliH/SctL family protein [Sphingomonas sp. KR1UV-12]MDP1028208.1 FliH/SctL family protein [Sphingomonas sp. KR1UV-12]